MSKSSKYISIIIERTIRQIRTSGEITDKSIKFWCEKNNVSEDFIRVVAGWHSHKSYNNVQDFR